LSFEPPPAIHVEERVVIAVMPEEIDLANARQLAASVIGAVPNDALGVVLDLVSTTYLDSSGIHLVFDLSERLRARQQRLALAVPDGSHIRRVLDLVDVTVGAAVEPTVDAAAAAVRAAV
jgi:anti-anti-sigma factor